MGSAVASLLLVASLRLQRRGHLFELAAHRTIDHFVAGGDAHAADQLLVEGDPPLDPALHAPRDVRDEAVGLPDVTREDWSVIRLCTAFEVLLSLGHLPVDVPAH